jgi:hypothetical protein
MLREALGVVDLRLTDPLFSHIEVYGGGYQHQLLKRHMAYQVGYMW